MVLELIGWIGLILSTIFIFLTWRNLRRNTKKIQEINKRLESIRRIK